LASAEVIRDESEAIQDRLILIEFPFRFEGKKQDENLINKLTTEEEIEGMIAQWALPGLASLLKEGGFDIPSRTSELLKDYKKTSDPFSDFSETL